jgi:hypothetical protein
VTRNAPAGQESAAARGARVGAAPAPCAAGCASTPASGAFKAVASRRPVPERLRSSLAAPAQGQMQEAPAPWGGPALQPQHYFLASPRVAQLPGRDEHGRAWGAGRACRCSPSLSGRCGARATSPAGRSAPPRSAVASSLLVPLLDTSLFKAPAGVAAQQRPMCGHAASPHSGAAGSPSSASAGAGGETLRGAPGRHVTEAGARAPAGSSRSRR